MAESILGRSEPVTLLATSRKAVDLCLTPANQASKVFYLALDVMAENSIASFFDIVKSQFRGNIDAMIQNAGSSPYEEPGQLYVRRRSSGEYVETQ